MHVDRHPAAGKLDSLGTSPGPTKHYVSAPLNSCSAKYTTGSLELLTDLRVMCFLLDIVIPSNTYQLVEITFLRSLTPQVFSSLRKSPGTIA